MTTKEIIEQACRYRDAYKEICEANGDGDDALSYASIKWAFVVGAQWMQEQVVHIPDNEEDITAEELAHQLYGAECQRKDDIEKAWKWMLQHIKLIGSPLELLIKFKQAMER